MFFAAVDNLLLLAPEGDPHSVSSVTQVDFDFGRLYRASGKEFLSHCSPAEPVEEQSTTLSDLSILCNNDNHALKFSPFTADFFEQGGRILFDTAAADFKASLPQGMPTPLFAVQFRLRSLSPGLFILSVHKCTSHA